MENNGFLTTTEAAKILGISRIAVFKRIKKGQIKAIRIGRNFVISRKSLPKILGKLLSKKKEERN